VTASVTTSAEAVVIAVLVLAAQASLPHACPTADDVVSVYCEAVHELLHRYGAPVARIVLIDRTKLGLLGDLDEQYAARTLQVNVDAVRNLKAVNQKPTALPANLQFEALHVMLPEAAAISAYQPVVTDPPRAGNLLVALSAISFSADREQALVYGSFTCGGMCGQGVIMRMAKGADGWRVARVLEVWIS
jgi:hypothetical protein